MADAFQRFPHTPHLAWLGEELPRADKVMDAAEARAFLSHDVVVEEKVDGANIGISIAADGGLRVQNRGAFLERPWSGQFKHLDRWLAPREDALFDALEDRFILFGEWCAARHSIAYDRLPDWFLGFDLFDRRHDVWLGVERRDALLRNVGLVPIRRVAAGRFSVSSLTRLLAASESAYHDGPVEGFYVRVEADGRLLSRAKLVRSDFVQAIEAHWRGRMIEWNTLDPRAAA